MAHDVFLSYSRTDGSVAKLLAAVLETAELSVWWDRDLLPTGEVTYEAMIEQRLHEASSVLVLWSRRAAESAWVKAEADLGRKGEKLVQVRLDSASLPLPFNSYPCGSLVGWSGDAYHPEIVALVAAIRRSISPRQRLTQAHNYYRPPEDIPTFGYKLEPPYRFQAIRASLRPRELLMCFLRDPKRQGWNSACHVGSSERLEDFQRDHGDDIELYAVDRGKLGGDFDESV